MRKGVIYTLSDPNTNLVRYVGQTICKPERRFAQHIYQWKRVKGKLTHVNSWIKNLSKENKIPLIEIIIECNENELNDLEIQYIKLYKAIGAKLTNHSEGGKGTRGFKQSKESITKRIESCKNSNLWKEKHKNHSEIMKQKHKEGTYNFGYLNLPKEKRIEIGKKIVKNRPTRTIINIENKITKETLHFESIKEAKEYFKCNLGTIRDFIYEKRKFKFFKNFELKSVYKNKYDKK